jgi:hypothetical protein
LPIANNFNNAATFKINGTDITKGLFVVDADITTTTLHNDSDSDDDGLPDGTEDQDRNGIQTFGETDPNDKDTDGGNPEYQWQSHWYIACIDYDTTFFYSCE